MQYSLRPCQYFCGYAIWKNLEPSSLSYVRADYKINGTYDGSAPGKAVLTCRQAKLTCRALSRRYVFLLASKWQTVASTAGNAVKANMWQRTACEWAHRDALSSALQRMGYVSQYRLRYQDKCELPPVP
eukprot:scaffold322826_cov25-Prasinocladus_malaysianus.AAC.1